MDIISSYKRASNIIENELKDNKLELADTADPGIFKNDFEKNLFKKIKELKKYFINIDNDENYETTLDNLKTAKPIIFAFFDNIIVNDNDEIIRKNRLELLQMFCRTFENYINFSKIERLMIDLILNFNSKFSKKKLKTQRIFLVEKVLIYLKWEEWDCLYLPDLQFLLKFVIYFIKTTSSLISK